MQELLIRYKHLLLTVLLLAFLVPPFLLTRVRSSWEPYPALLLPAGAQVVRHADKEYAYQVRQLWATPVGGDTMEWVNLNDVFPKLRATRINPQLKRDFYLGKEHDEEERRRTQDWLRRRLTEAGYEPDEITIRVVRMNVAVNTGRSHVDTVVHEANFELR